MSEDTWTLQWCPRADKYARRLPAWLRAVLTSACAQPERAKPLLSGGWTVRVAGLRAVVEMDRGQRVVTVIAVGPRGEVYRHLGMEHGSSERARCRGVAGRRSAREAGRTG